MERFVSKIENQSAEFKIHMTDLKQKFVSLQGLREYIAVRKCMDDNQEEEKNRLES